MASALLQGCDDSDPAGAASDADAADADASADAAVDANADDTTNADAADADAEDLYPGPLNPIQPALGQLVIPAAGLAFGPLAMISDSQEGGADGQLALKIDASLTLALGEPYPQRFDATLTAPYDMRCGLLSGDIALTGLQGEDPKVARLSTSGRTLTIDAVAEGQAAVRLQATYTLTEQDRSRGCLAQAAGAPITTAALNIDLTLRVRAFNDAAIDLPFRCVGETTAYAISGAQPTELRAYLRADGAFASPANAHPLRPVTVTVTGPPDALLALDPPDGDLSNLRFPDVEDAVSITTSVGGARQNLQVLSPSRIDDVTAHFALAGYGGATIPLASGETYSSFHRSSDRIVTTVSSHRVGGVQVCTDINPAWFSLESATPDTCTPDLAPAAYPELPTGTSTRQAAHVIADGPCSVTLRAPTLGPNGMTWPLSATFKNTDTMNSPW